MPLTILHVSIWFQKEAPSSRENRTPPFHKKIKKIMTNVSIFIYLNDKYANAINYLFISFYALVGC